MWCKKGARMNFPEKHYSIDILKSTHSLELRSFPRYDIDLLIITQNSEIKIIKDMKNI